MNFKKMGCGAYHTVVIAGYPLDSLDLVRHEQNKIYN